MACIYRYTDKEDGIIKYVGIIWGKTRTLTQRVNEHKRDDWHKGKNWKIETLEIENLSHTDAEYMEAHYIALYGTWKWYNKAKTGWGISRFIKDNPSDWKEFVPSNERARYKNKVADGYLCVHASLFTDESWQKLSYMTRQLYLCMVLESGGSSCFCFPKSLAEEYGFSPSGFWACIRELIENGFIEKVSGKFTREKNLYGFANNEWAYAVGQSGSDK